MRVVFRNDRNNGHTRLQRQMERALLERQQLRSIRVAARALGEDEDTLAMVAHLIGSTIESLDGRFAVGTINEDGAREGHEPAEEGNMFEGLLGRDAAVRREDVAEHEHIQFGLVVSNEDGGPGVQVFSAFDNVEAHAGGVAHNPLETARGGPLGDAAVASDTEHN